MEDSYKELESGHAEYIELLNHETEQVLIHNTDRDMDSIFDELYKCCAHVYKQCKTKQQNEKEKRQIKGKC